MKVQWYPGHMTKAMRNMQEDCRLVDLIIELVDARVPLSSRNPDIDRLGQGKARLIIMNKADLADPVLTDRWKAWFEDRHFLCAALDCRVSGMKKSINPILEEACQAKRERDRRRGIANRPLRAMVVGIPNVGKSTFINTFAGHSAAKTGNSPGVTKGNQWIRLNKNVELLDTPGVLWPKFDDDQVGVRLAAVGSINDDILDTQELSGYVLDFMLDNYPGALLRRYPCAEVQAADGPDRDLRKKDNPELARYRLLQAIAVCRGCIARGAQPDLDKASRMLLEDFRSGRLGRVTLEAPDQT